MVAKYAVSKTGLVMGRFDGRVQDGARWCVDYNGETTGMLCKDENKVGEFEHLEEAVRYSRKVRAEVLTERYREELASIESGNWIGY